jgi:trimeric autotransporter adhesin
MKSRFLPKLSYSNVIASIALFVALGGAAVAAGLPKNSVGSNQLKRGAVTAAKLKKAAVTSGKLAPKAVIAGKLGPNAVLPGNIGNGAITSAKIGAGAVIASSIKNGVITNPKLGSGVVNTAKLAANAVTTPILANESVTPAKLSKEFGPIVSTLKSGQTLRGVFDVGGSSKSPEPASFRAAETFQFPLLASPAPNVMPVGATSPACSGLGTGNATPQAAGGQLCVYITGATPEAELSIDANSNNRLGFGLLAKFKKAETDNFVQGVWAVTAP